MLLCYEAGRCWPEAALPGGIGSQACAVCSPKVFWGEPGSFQPPEHTLQRPRPCHFPEAINLRGALQRDWAEVSERPLGTAWEAESSGDAGKPNAPLLKQPRRNEGDLAVRSCLRFVRTACGAGRLSGDTSAAKTQRLLPHNAQTELTEEVTAPDIA